MNQDFVFPVLFLVAPVLILASTLVALYVAGRRQRYRARVANLIRRHEVDHRIEADEERHRLAERRTAFDALARAYDTHQDLIDECLETARRALPARDEDGRGFMDALPALILASLVKIGAREGLSAEQVEGIFLLGLRRPARGDPAYVADAAKRRLIEDLAKHLDADVRLMLEEQGGPLA
jgi:hypothetical protein